MSKETDELARKNHEDIQKINMILGFGKVVVTVCVTATLAIAGMLWQLGGWLYENSGPLKTGISAWLEAKRNGQ